MWDLSFPARDQTSVSRIGRWILNYWTIRWVPDLTVLNSAFLLMLHHKHCQWLFSRNTKATQKSISWLTHHKALADPHAMGFSPVGWVQPNVNQLWPKVWKSLSSWAKDSRGPGESLVSPRPLSWVSSFLPWDAFQLSQWGCWASAEFPAGHTMSLSQVS